MKKGSALTCGSWTAAKWLYNKLAAEERSTIDIVHCYDAINSYLKRCLNRDSHLPIVTALVLPYIEKAKEISHDELKEEINKGLKGHEIIDIFRFYYKASQGQVPYNNMNKRELVQKLVEQLVSDSVERDGTDNSTGAE